MNLKARIESLERAAGPGAEYRCRSGEPWRPWEILTARQDGVYTTDAGQSYTESDLTELQKTHRLVIMRLSTEVMEAA